VTALAPWAHAVHLKDQAVEEYADGFLLGDIPLGQGALDLAAMVDVLRAAKPGMRFTLELITRDPLRVPCNTEGYWATFPDVPRGDLDRTMEFVREHATHNLQYVAELSADEQVALENENVRASLEFARERLMIGA
jgi:sugar phosphate isomerase/epimerase